MITKYQPTEMAFLVSVKKTFDDHCGIVIHIAHTALLVIQMEIASCVMCRPASCYVHT